MNKKNSFKITLSGKSYTLCGTESKEYLEAIGMYIESKYAEFSRNPAFNSQSSDMKHILLQLNIADDYFKCREELAVEKRKLEEQLLEVEKLQNSLVSMQVKCENLEANMNLVEKNYQEAKTKILRMETKLKTKMR